jgi:hypothetical protein
VFSTKVSIEEPKTPVIHTFANLLSSLNQNASSSTVTNPVTVVKHPQRLTPHPETLDQPQSTDDRLFAVIALKGKQFKVTKVNYFL